VGVRCRIRIGEQGHVHLAASPLRRESMPP
jgi:hypothetical protein